MTAIRLSAFCLASSLILLAQPRAQQKKLRQELSSGYAIWIECDVAYIITDEERKAFHGLQTDDERDHFVEQFWQRRDPTPDTEENEFKEEHYRRMAYANERYASGIPGWRTDRGRTYIVFGPPDEVEPHPSGGSYQAPPEQGGVRMTTLPFEIWRYRYLEGIGSNILIEFVDATMTGEFRMALNTDEKDALAHTPMRSSLTTPVTGSTDNHLFDRLKLYADLQRPPRFKDLEAVVTSAVRYNLLPMKVRADYLRVTDASVLTPVTIQFENKDLQFRQQAGVERAAVNLYLRVTSMTRRVVTVHEDVVTVDSPPGMLEQVSRGSSLYQKGLLLAPGLYRLNVVAKDVYGGNMTSTELLLTVPRYEPDRLSMSSVILADVIERTPLRSVGAGQFQLRNWKVRPRVSETFRRDEPMGVWFELYGLDGGGSVEYQILRVGSSDVVGRWVDAVAGMDAIHRKIPLASLTPGAYTLKVIVTGGGQTAGSSVRFTVGASM